MIKIKKVSQKYANIVDLFNKLAEGKSMQQVFQDCIEIFAITIPYTSFYKEIKNGSEIWYTPFLLQMAAI